MTDGGGARGLIDLGMKILDNIIGKPDDFGDDENDLQKAIVASIEWKRPREGNGKAADDFNVIDLDDCSDDEDNLQKAVVVSMEGKRPREENGKAADDVQRKKQNLERAVEGDALTVKKRRKKGAAGEEEEHLVEKKRRRKPSVTGGRKEGAGAGEAGAGQAAASSRQQKDVVDLTNSPRVQVGESNRPSIQMIHSKLLELGLEPAVAARKAEVAHRQTSTLAAAINHAVLQCEDVQKEDMITGELVSTRDMFICECDCRHMLTYESFFRKILSDMRDRCVPACPLNGIPSGCKYVLTQKETEDVVSAVMQNDAWRAELVDDATLALLELQPDQMLVNGQRGWKSQLVSRIYMEKIITEGGFIECPQEGCGWFVEAHQARRFDANTQEIVCQKCGFRFCAECKKMSHLNTPCEQMLSYARQWDEWLETGRPRALEKMAQVDQQFGAALQAHNAMKEQHEADMRNRKTQYEQMLADEKWKEKNCKRCPHCQFVVNKLDGCNEMVCGRDYHGNVVQGGCGKVFHWLNMALPYVADTGHHPKVVNFSAAAPELAEEMKQKFALDGTMLVCSLCSDKILGPHAVCLNCPNWGRNGVPTEGMHQVCIKCQGSSATAHSCSTHLSSHVCRVFIETQA